jgi:4-amino-4-deoxy-L-arabinose transferase-like glycosyltransferase
LPRAPTPDTFPSPTGRGVQISNRIAIALIVAVAIATRIVSWWNPVAHVDDQFYMLAGQELLTGHWPYIDVWDRKPLGLFILYAGIAAIGGKSILAMNLVATAFATATAIMVRQIALRFATSLAALFAAFTYLFVLPLYGGQNGQSPVFYNPLIAGSVLLLLRAAEGRGSIRTSAFAAMLLCGLAMTIKQTSFVEGTFIGLAFLWLLHRSAMRPIAIAGTGAVMVAIALAPTLLCFLAYWLQGPAAAHEFVYANFISIFERQSWSPLARLAGIALLFLYLFPLFIMAGIGAASLWRSRKNDLPTALLVGWLAAAILGYLSVPAFFDHYALPLVAPLSVAAAVFYGSRSGPLFFAGYLVFCLIQGSMLDWKSNRDEAARYELIRQTVDKARRGGCLYVSDGPSRLYSEFPDCRPTRYLFPDHLVLVTEMDAVGVNTADEVANILASRPEVVVTRVTRKGRHPVEIRTILASRLRQDYRPLLSTPKGESKSVDGITVWQRQDLTPPPG